MRLITNLLGRKSRGVLSIEEQSDIQQRTLLQVNEPQLQCYIENLSGVLPVLTAELYEYALRASLGDDVYHDPSIIAQPVVSNPDASLRCVELSGIAVLRARLQGPSK